ncbi:LacI family DNA-binding transcriptional regulator [Hoeflea prorocentri]|uniref:LacI family DNA-binding transcriptional regulator n=1 Tax=Hoeflea prorocentri TaxID=1922333 RepID=A0A9X3UL56_9HYPH|nr:LacI family DNA-binding transcriptional regulator [Hoeflea prorocentri]MCY6382808.1 LacI family DNA-binding transcriptional regulator [Hoeflea prorocentri]MDA5400608.1 LacI family DNA-binding transcriptional regulator [Hoeflea prorocentri]
MVKRPTIPDLAEFAGVSVSTVNRVVNGSDSVRQPTRERILRAAEEIGFYGLGSIEHEVKRWRETHKLGVLLQQGNRAFSRTVSDALYRAAAEDLDGTVELTVEFLDDLTADTVAARLIDLGERCESVALLAAGHPILSNAIDTVLQTGVPVTALVSQLSAKGNVSFVGLDNWKVGRTAAWAFDKIVRQPGKIGILVGNHRYRCQELNESGFRSYFREYNPSFTLLEPLSTYESAAVAREKTEYLLAEHPDMCGLFVSGGGITGALAALRDQPRREDFFTVGYELYDATRTALIDGTLNFVISHPFEIFARKALATMIKAKKNGSDAGAQNVSLEFDIYTSENV